MQIQELQALKEILRDTIRSYEYSLEDIKGDIRYLYSNSTTDTEIGKTFFRMLNGNQNEKRKLQAKLKKLRALQVSLKKEIIAENEYLNFSNGVVHLINGTVKD
jgi:hypothetical protein